MKEQQYINGEENEIPPIERLAYAIDGLTKKIDNFITFSKDAIPKQMVVLIFILVFALIFGIEAVKFLFEHYLPGLIK